MNANIHISAPLLPPQLHELGVRDYTSVWQEMRGFTDTRGPDTVDEIWCLQHTPVFTLGQNGKPEHILDAGDIPVVKCDRGGQVTYHGPGQLVMYLLLDLRRRHLGIKDLVARIEQAIIDYLATLNISGERRPGAPGVYVDGAKIAALGLRVRRGCSYHGLSFNVNMDLKPYSRINPCGDSGLISTDLNALLHSPPDLAMVQTQIYRQLLSQLAS